MTLFGTSPFQTAVPGEKACGDNEDSGGVAVGVAATPFQLNWASARPA
jgi:hypothetical protein